MAFDEHVLVNKMKFGIIYQKRGQTTEEEMFGNEMHSPAMEEFLQLLGDKVELKGFSGHRADPRAADNQKNSGDSGHQPCPFPAPSLSQAKLIFDLVVK
ncbi:rap1 GTPase-activating protein 1 [Trichonephila clavipes]|nr:rap1 GTPase-activating protein 1 [Trichonephila clavipes]